MKFASLWSALLFSAAPAWANSALEADLTKIDQLLTERSFGELVSLCDQEVTFSQTNMVSRESAQFKATYKDCEAGKLTMKVKRKEGKVGSRKAKYNYNLQTYTTFNKNPLRELLHELTHTLYLGQILSLDDISVYQMKETKTSLRTKKGYQDFDTFYVWLDVKTLTGDQQLHVTLSTDARLSHGARLIEVFFNLTPLLQVTAVE
jgi:hypothetical protein